MVVTVRVRWLKHMLGFYKFISEYYVVAPRDVGWEGSRCHYVHKLICGHWYYRGLSILRIDIHLGNGNINDYHLRLS